jgi:hypothetical protein
MARAKRRRPHDPAKIHDRRSRDLPRNAEVAAVEVDDPLGLEPGDKIVTLRSIRYDPLGRMHRIAMSTRRNTRAGGPFRPIGKRPSVAHRRSIQDFRDGGQMRSRLPTPAQSGDGYRR